MIFHWVCGSKNGASPSAWSARTSKPGRTSRSASALFDEVISPALGEAGLDPAAFQLIRNPDRQAAVELVRHPALIPLVILRGSGETTRALAAEAARAGVRTLAPADGGGVLYIDRAARA